MSIQYRTLEEPGNKAMYQPHIQVVGEGFRSISNTLGLLGVVLPLHCISVEPHVPDCLYWTTHTMQRNTGVCMCVWRGKERGTIQLPSMTVSKKLQLRCMKKAYNAHHPRTGTTYT